MDNSKDMADVKHIETYKSLIYLSAEGYKALLLLNGGGALAVLTFIGAHMGQINRWVVLPMACFLSGLVSIAVVYFLAYKVQFNIYHGQNPDMTFVKARNWAVYSLVLFSFGCMFGTIWLLITS
ncbi:hypothetical protein [Acidithiobacillus ferriphilus]|jgi:hypothetical protein|uniref:hypothetical protein n=1 Tax=Acidithiobacillus ferriphilus TaxID=1689834 RepID=UPI001C064B5C|nr:hypothetical protein [Acidithiobacillus ferriphilus]MBU2827103.1 hypothetical protein [Acidithiobacillus ferriphilus]MBU2829100.1 hypothetical protein [Acidithiobacillus ferriphilus]MBU2846756.1 hypothetical protein [Acidithiobacillus ferriphilus]